MRPLWRILTAVAIALVALILYDGVEVNPETFALDPTVTLATEAWEGQTFTASDVAGIKMLVQREQAELPDLAAGCPPFLILWLGNSQLHYINQARDGDHVAPFWLRKASTCPSGTVPLGISLPNANLQEHYILADYVWKRLPVRLLLLELCFDDLREDGLRDEFSMVLARAESGTANQRLAWRRIVQRAEAGWQHSDRSEENSGLEGFAQKDLEDRLDGAIGQVWPLWRDRQNLRVKALTDLYYVRNGLLGIKPTTIRKLIAARYERNMNALEALLQEAQAQNIKVIAYVAPIRHDVLLPYDLKEYGDWKRVVAELSRKYDAEQINLENLVPADLWGSYVAQDIDFMHFRGKGHQLLAGALLPYVETVRREH
jgi:hypothetical protein